MPNRQHSAHSHDKSTGRKLSQSSKVIKLLTYMLKPVGQLVYSLTRMAGCTIRQGKCINVEPYAQPSSLSSSDMRHRCHQAAHTCCCAYCCGCSPYLSYPVLATEPGPLVMRVAGTEGRSLYSLLPTADMGTLEPFSLPLGCLLILFVTELIRPPVAYNSICVSLMQRCRSDMHKS